MPPSERYLLHWSKFSSTNFNLLFDCELSNQAPTPEQVRDCELSNVSTVDEMKSRKETVKYMFSEGMSVEVSSDEDGFQDILKCLHVLGCFFLHLQPQVWASRAFFGLLYVEFAVFFF